MTPDRGSQMETQELMPCPFCGGEARFYPAQVLIDGKCPESITCSNNDCPGQPATDYLPVADAIAAWNTRAQSAQIATLQAEVERLTRECHFWSDCAAVRYRRIQVLEAARAEAAEARKGEAG